MNDSFGTERMVLRLLTADDAELLYELDSDAEVMRFLSGGAATPLDVICDEILPGFLREAERSPGFGYWAALDRSSGEFLGWFSLRRPEDGDASEAEIGYRLRRAAWDRGLATEGARALLDRAFGTPGIERVFATTYEENGGSRRVMEKLGMGLVRTFRFTPADLAAQHSFDAAPGEPWEGDDVEYAITRDEWRAENGERRV